MVNEKAKRTEQLKIDPENRQAEHDRSLYGVLADAVTREVDDEDWGKVRQEAWEAAAEDGEL